MADDYNTEQKKLAEQLQEATKAFKKANSGTDQLEKAQRDYVSAVTGLNAAVIQAKKSLSDTIKQQNQINQKNSIINNTL